MPFILENNYILEANYRSLMAMLIDTGGGSRLFMNKPFIDEYISLLNNQEAELEEVKRTEDDEEGTIYRSPSKGPLSLEELNDLYPEWEDLISEIEADFSDEKETDSFPDVRLVLYRYREKDSAEFYETVARLLPDFGKYFNMYKERVNALPVRHLIWSQYWIGFVDSEENMIYMSKNNDGTITLEYIDNWGDPIGSEYEYIFESNIFNELEIATVDQIKNASDFLVGFKKLLMDPSKSDFANKIPLEELEFNFQDLAAKINATEPPFQINAEELEAAMSELKNK